MGDLMYRLFLPETVQDQLRTTTCSLTIATNDLELPWEFMHYDHTPDPQQPNPQPDDDVKNFLCLSRPIARRLMGRPLPNDPAPRRDHPTKRQFLFIANPTGDLPGAEREVAAVVADLQQHWADQIEVTVLKGAEASGRRLNQLLRSDQYDVIHYSGHAFFDDNDPDYSGLLLHNREIFFADKVRRLLGGRPLVFLNACESARSANEGRTSTLSYNLQKPAQGLAASFVYGGALGCIGSLWPINDLRAANFAAEFYNQVLEGQLIGEAMRRARVRIKSNEPNEITWAAFVLYGDPTFRLVE
jgi:CHAT domain-containing protein